MKKRTITLLATLLLMGLGSQQALPGEINGRTYISSLIEGFKITVPEGWIIQDLERRKESKGSAMIAVLRRTEPIQGQLPHGFVQIIAGQDSIEEASNELIKSFPKKKDVLEITRSKIQIDGKPAEIIHTVLHRKRDRESWIYIMKGKEHVFYLILVLTNLPSVEADAEAIIGSIRYK